MMVVDIIWFELDRISPCNPFPNLLSFSDVQGLSQPHQLCSFVDTLTSIKYGEKHFSEVAHNNLQCF